MKEPQLKQRGFTLIELIIAVAIVGILAAVAYPSYMEHIRQSRRADATAALVELAQFMERFYTVNHRYDQDIGGNAVVLPFTESPKDGANKFYDLSLSALTATTYTLRAAPKSSDACGNLTLTNTGVRARTGTGDRCWR